MEKSINKATSLLHTLTLDQNDEKLLKQSSILGKGDGLVALKNITYGELIIKEIPIITVSWQDKKCDGLDGKFYRLTNEERNSVMKLMDCQHADKMKTLEGIFLTNSISLSEQEEGLFIILSRLNHSCIPNVGLMYVEPYLRAFASRNIKEGEELCFSYSDAMYAQYEERQRILNFKWGFVCQCELCDMQPFKREEIETARNQYKKVEDKINGLSENTSEAKSLMLFILKCAIKGRLLNPQVLHEYHKNMVTIENNLENFSEARRHGQRALNEAKILYGTEFWLVDFYRQYAEGHIDI